jgi:uncharacterized protein with PIN domain
VIESQDLAGQLAELGSRFALGEHARPFSRCNRCNEPLEPASAAQASAQAPRRVLATQRAFLRCPRCSRLYWAGSHVARMRELLGVQPGGVGAPRGSDPDARASTTSRPAASQKG